ncbi:MAG: ribosome maturation factor RimM [Bacillota bacterium]
MIENKYITIGKITKNQGNRGEVRVIPLTDFPERFLQIERVFLVKNSQMKKKTIENVRFHKKFVILKFDEIDDIGAAFELKDYYVKIKEEELAPLLEDEYYIYQIVGFKVITVDGTNLGPLKEVLTTGGTDILIVEGNNKDYMIPGTKEIVTKVDMENEEIIIDPIPGLLDL